MTADEFFALSWDLMFIYETNIIGSEPPFWKTEDIFVFTCTNTIGSEPPSERPKTSLYIINTREHQFCGTMVFQKVSPRTGLLGSTWILFLLRENSISWSIRCPPWTLNNVILIWCVTLLPSTFHPNNSSTNRSCSATNTRRRISPRSISQLHLKTNFRDEQFITYNSLKKPGIVLHTRPHHSHQLKFETCEARTLRKNNDIC